MQGGIKHMQGYWYKATVISDEQWYQIMYDRGFLDGDRPELLPPFGIYEPVLIQPISNDPDNYIVMTSGGKMHFPYPASLFGIG
jgi:hypothetical protein